MHFHWIPVQTNRKFHCHVDRIASHALQQHSTYTVTVHKILQNNTDAVASGVAHNP